jgi:4-diphosphocytidyl-2-C-methyl-D-erythritol kinase
MAAICRGRGEQITAIRDVPRWPLVLIKPPVGLSTAAVYRECRVPATPRSAVELVEVLRRRHMTDLGRVLFNRLQEVAEKLSPQVRAVRRACEQADVIGHAMSGSGSSYFAVCRSVSQARHLAARLRAQQAGQVFMTMTT